ncbi:MAG: ArsR family transcriptional regulator [Candidatus Thorarchaeota archaeon]|nr:ArsR family transcriptional regulator [Candidatus Thorarchaeota archaeon]
MEAVRILTGDQAVDAVRALYDENRRRILNALKARTMSATELVQFFEREYGTELKPQTIRYHLKELEKSGLIIQNGYEPAGNGGTHIMKKMYTASAETVLIATSKMSDFPDKDPLELKQIVDIVSVMRNLGFAIPENGEVKVTIDKFLEWDKLWRKGRDAAREVLEEVPELDPTVYITLRRILSVLQLNDKDYERYWEVSRNVTDIFREAYRAGAGKNPEVY